MIDPPSRLILLGHPVGHSISPRFQNAALKAAGIPLTYSVRDVAPHELDAVLAELAVERAAGNVTIPHKEAVAARCTVLTPLAARCGAANVFWHEDGALIGDNSDVGGVEMMLHTLVGAALRDARLAILGAGGAAASVVCAAERCGISRVRVYNRDMARADALCARFDGLALASQSVADALQECTVVINATPVGMRDDAHPVPVSMLPPGAAVFDLVYRPGETSWVRDARAAGHRAADGEGMLLEQGALAFERWFGIAPDRGAMWRALH